MAMDNQASRSAIYERLGVRPLINAAGNLTIYGGSLMSEDVLQAMHEAAGTFVDLEELQQKASSHLADILGVEAAYITSGAAAGVAICAATAMTRLDRDKVGLLPNSDDIKNEIVMQVEHRNGFMKGAVASGGRLVEFDGGGSAALKHLERVLSPRTCAYFHFAHCESIEGSLSLVDVVSICRPRGIPVIVDAAAELPPKNNFTRYLDEGADAAIFSGGKQLGGPQSSGLIVGKKEFIAGCVLNGPPRHSIGRTMKVGKEEIAGLVRAVELFVACDEDALLAAWEVSAQRIEKGLTNVIGLGASDVPSSGQQGIQVRLVRWGERGTQPQIVPRVYVDLPAGALAQRSEIMESLKRRNPGVIVDKQSRGLAISPQTLKPGEEKVVTEAVSETLRHFVS